MKIFGEDYGFMLTIGASAEIAKLCPDGDISRMSEVIGGNYADAVNFSARFIVAMANGYDDKKRFDGEEVTHRPLTVEMIMALPGNLFAEIQTVALAAFGEDVKPSVETKPSKKKGSRTPALN